MAHNTADTKTIPFSEKTSHPEDMPDKSQRDLPAALADEIPLPVPADADAHVLTGLTLFLVFVSLMLCAFMFALDQSIVSTAIPVIISEFTAFEKVAWIITAYFLTQAGLILLFGQLLTILKSKYILLSAIFWFELGSLICGVAPDMNVLIFGRAIQGIGSAGLFISLLAIIAQTTRLEQRAMFLSFFGLVFVISSVSGPLLGGVLTEKASWRWCFYINLPIGGIAAASVVFLLPAIPPHVTEGKRVGWAGIRDLDFIGSALIFGIITCLLLALQWGGTDYSWSNWRIIFLFVLAGVLVPCLFFWEKRQDIHALIPLAVLKNRTQIFATINVFFLFSCMLGGTYQLPLFYQATRNHSPVKSGIDVIPFMVSVVFGIGVSGTLVNKFGRYWPFMIAGPPIAIIGNALLYTVNADTKSSALIGYQILAGLGIGLAFQNGMLSVQAEYKDRPHLVNQATSLVSFGQLTGGAIGIGIINTVQSVVLAKQLPIYAPDADFGKLRSSVAAIYDLPLEQQGGAIHAYISAITQSFLPLIATAALALFCAFFVRNHSMKGAAPAHAG